MSELSPIRRSIYSYSPSAACALVQNEKTFACSPRLQANAQFCPAVALAYSNMRPHAQPHRSLSGQSLINDIMEINNTQTLSKAIQEIAPFCVGWALTDKVGDLESLSGAKRRMLMYKEFDIPKRSGGTRRITAPIGKLKDIQKCISVILSPYYQSPDCAHGFAEGKSVATNAHKHIGNNYIFNIDLQDFFPSISYVRVSNALEHLGFNEEVSTLIARLCTIPVRDEQRQIWRSVLPQGSPASPLLSNIVCILLDRRLSNLSNKYGLVYSRYADDITFSSNHSVYAQEGNFRKELKEIIESSGFRINEKKTRLQKK